MNRRAVAIIPARGGSKRIPYKNIEPFCGKPIIAYSIDAARESRLFDRIIVSTDDDRIAEVARKFGGETPFVRPAKLSDDLTGTNAVVRHATDWLAKQERPVELVCCIYATAPFVDGETLRRGLEIMQTAGAEFAMGVTTFDFPIQRALRLRADGRMEPREPDAILARSQDLEQAWHDAGQFYWGTPRVFTLTAIERLAQGVPVILPRHRVQDIDTEEDWLHAELMFEALRRRVHALDAPQSTHGKVE